ncbi:MAG: 4Fe-4S binding protein, partial [Firmicutes bacterium]|nr:4Fe-4S binding protein [Bacillota bacterium]
GGPAAIFSDGAIQVMQFALIGLGLAASLFTACKISKNRFGEGGSSTGSLLPYAVLLVALAAVNIYLFTLPMSMRM